MAIELVTGYQGRDHVTADQWADFNRGIFGDAAILPVGNKMEVAIQTANKITVKDGIAVIDGRQVSIGYGESENITIKSGTQGKLRRDIVVLEYKRVEDTGVESVQFKVIDGTPATSNAQDPAVRNTDIRTGAIVSQKPFCRVRLNGTAIEGVDSLIRVKELKDMAFYEPVNNLVGTDPKMALAAPMGKELKKSIAQINTNLANKTTFGYFSFIAKNNGYNQITNSNITTGNLPNGINTFFVVIGQGSNNNHVTTFHFDNQSASELFCITNVPQSYSVRWIQFNN